MFATGYAGLENRQITPLAYVSLGPDPSSGDDGHDDPQNFDVGLFDETLTQLIADIGAQR